MKLGRVDVPGHDMEDLCRRWQLQELAVYDSVHRDDFGPESDVDPLVTFAPNLPGPNVTTSPGFSAAQST